MQFQKSIKGVKNEKDFTFVEGGGNAVDLSRPVTEIGA